MGLTSTWVVSSNPLSLIDVSPLGRLPITTTDKARRYRRRAPRRTTHRYPFSPPVVARGAAPLSGSSAALSSPGPRTTAARKGRFMARREMSILLLTGLCATALGCAGEADDSADTERLQATTGVSAASLLALTGACRQVSSGKFATDEGAASTVAI